MCVETWGWEECAGRWWRGWVGGYVGEATCPGAQSLLDVTEPPKHRRSRGLGRLYRADAGPADGDRVVEFEHPPSTSEA